MHGHTGFLITSRRLAPGVTPPLRKRRPAKGSTDEEGALQSGLAFGAESDFTAEDVGERIPSDKKFRRLRRSVAGPTPPSDETSGAVCDL
jgi:tRNA (adenine57-N1/adenine58-N1)-methyltransferase